MLNLVYCLFDKYVYLEIFTDNIVQLSFNMFDALVHQIAFLEYFVPADHDSGLRTSRRFVVLFKKYKATSDLSQLSARVDPMTLWTVNYLLTLAMPAAGSVFDFLKIG